MKKLIVAAAIVCAAAMSQAAAVEWKATGSSAEEGYNVYILLSAGSGWTSEADVLKASIDNAQIVSQSGGRSYANTPSIAQNAGITKSTTTLYAVVVTANGQKYATTSFDPSASVYDPDATPPETKTSTAGFSVKSLSYKNFETVPEPTSGLLLLFGVAGLALRRRRAYL